MSKPDRSRVIRLAEAEGSIPGPAGEHAIVVFRRGPLDVALSLPMRPSQQTPHIQDEIYFIVRGRGVLLHDGKRDRYRSLRRSDTLRFGGARVFEPIESGIAINAAERTDSDCAEEILLDDATSM